MRLNKFLSQHTELSRRSADKAIENGRIKINGKIANLGEEVNDQSVVLLDNQPIVVRDSVKTTIILNKPVGYVCSRNGQGSRTVYELLSDDLQHLNCVGRLDKNSSGLLVFTNDGELANQLTHPSFGKVKIYEVELNKSLLPLHQQMINDIGINLEDGPSKLILEKLQNDKSFKITMREGRNRQIRRTFAALGYDITKLHRTNLGNYTLTRIRPGKVSLINL